MCPFFPFNIRSVLYSSFVLSILIQNRIFTLKVYCCLIGSPNSNYTTLKSEIFRDIFRFQIDLDITFVKSHHWDVPVGTQHFEG